MEEKPMSLIGHLTELRKRFIVIAITFILSTTIGLVMATRVLAYIKEQPSAMNIDWNVFGYTDGLIIYIKCAMVVTVLFTLPMLLYQTWAFVKPGLTNEEAKGTLIYVPISFFLFLIGVTFSYYIVFPMVTQFMTTINQTIGATETYGMSQYFTLLFNIVIPISVIFEMPVVVMFLTKVGLLNPTKLRKMRKVSYFILVIVGVSLTPPDFIADILIIVPLLLLFEISILCSSFFVKKIK